MDTEKTPSYDHYSQDKPTRFGKWLVVGVSERIFEFAQIRQGCSLLEIGPGRGDFTDICLNNGVDYREIEPNEEMANALEKRGINVARLLKAFSSVCGKLPHDLILTGSKSWKDASVYQTMRDLGLTDRIKQLGYVEHEDMPALYNLAGVYVYPSLYEGFGLPVVEAMQCGCPVIASRTTSIPEVAGDAAILVDPLDIDAMADAIYQILTDHGLREKLVSWGLQQVQKFSWTACANIILETIRHSIFED